MPIFVRIGAHAVTFSGLPVRIVDLAFWVLWSIFGHQENVKKLNRA